MTLVAAWIVPAKDPDWTKPMVRVIADSCLTIEGKGTILDAEKISILEPMVMQPKGGLGMFSRLDQARTHTHLGFFYAGSSLSADRVLRKVQHELTHIGMTSKWCEKIKSRTGILVRNRWAKKFNLSPHFDGSIYAKLPEVDMRFAALIVRHCIRETFDDLVAKNEGVLVQSLSDLQLGMAGWCPLTDKARLFGFSLESGHPFQALKHPAVIMKEYHEDELLLLGSTEIKRVVNNRVAECLEKKPSDKQDPTFRRTMCYQTIVEQIISSNEFLNKGIGGTLRRALASEMLPFSFTENPWEPNGSYY